MPRPLHVCAEPGCSELCAGTYCEQHARPKTPRARDTRGSSTARGYGYQWQQTRAAFLKAYPWCMAAGCTKPATDVDHVTALAKGGTSDWDNLQALCHEHHSRKTARHDSKRAG
jgi:5-methylcytosine-specific restriction protein A